MASASAHAQPAGSGWVKDIRAAPAWPVDIAPPVECRVLLDDALEPLPLADASTQPLPRTRVSARARSFLCQRRLRKRVPKASLAAGAAAAAEAERSRRRSQRRPCPRASQSSQSRATASCRRSTSHTRRMRRSACPPTTSGRPSSRPSQPTSTSMLEICAPAL